MIVDINMPGIDGFQTARHPKRDRRLVRKSFLTQTGVDEPLVRQVASQIGFDGLVVKGGPMSIMIGALLAIPEGSGIRQYEVDVADTLFDGGDNYPRECLDRPFGALS